MGRATCLRFKASAWQAGAWLQTRVENIAKNCGFPMCNLRLATPTSSRARDFIGVANLSILLCSYWAGQTWRRRLNFARSAGLAKGFGVGVRCVFASLSAHCDADYQKRREDALAL